MLLYFKICELFSWVIFRNFLHCKHVWGILSNHYSVCVHQSLSLFYSVLPLLNQNCFFYLEMCFFKIKSRPKYEQNHCESHNQRRQKQRKKGKCINGMELKHHFSKKVCFKTARKVTFMLTYSWYNIMIKPLLWFCPFTWVQYRYQVISSNALNGQTPDLFSMVAYVGSCLDPLAFVVKCVFLLLFF